MAKLWYYPCDQGKITDLLLSSHQVKNLHIKQGISNVSGQLSLHSSSLTCPAAPELEWEADGPELRQETG